MIAVCIYTWCAQAKESERGRKQRACLSRLTFLQWSSLVLLQPLDCDGFQAYSGGRIFLEHVPHVLLAEDEEVRVADRAHAGCSPVTCVDVAIYWLSGCIKLSYVTARKIDLRVDLYGASSFAVRRHFRSTHDCRMHATLSAISRVFAFALAPARACNFD